MRLLGAFFLSGRKGWVVGFATEEVEAEGEEAGENGDDPKHPSPAFRLYEKATSYGTKNRSQQRTHRPDGHGASTLLLWEYIGYGSATDG